MIRPSNSTLFEKQDNERTVILYEQASRILCPKLYLPRWCHGCLFLALPPTFFFYLLSLVLQQAVQSRSLDLPVVRSYPDSGGHAHGLDGAIYHHWAEVFEPPSVLQDEPTNKIP